MHGLSSSSKEQINKTVENLFDKAALRFLGNIPSLNHKKHTLLGFEQNLNLANLFLQTSNNRWLNNTEQDVLKGLLMGALAYLVVLKNKTSNDIIQRLEGLARSSRSNDETISGEAINVVLKEEFDKAENGLKKIISSESTKTRNIGSAIEITRKAAIEDVEDPIVFFNVIRDNSTCPICIKLCLMPDGATPKLYRMSELSTGYYKRGDSVPSLLGQHPHCRCTLAYLSSNWGFDKRGFMTFIGHDHNELEKQRKA